MFAQNLEDNDEQQDVFDLFFELKEGSMVSKRVVMKKLETTVFPDFRNIKDYFAKRGIKYDSQRKYQKDKGVFLGVALKFNLQVM